MLVNSARPEEDRDSALCIGGSRHHRSEQNQGKALSSVDQCRWHSRHLQYQEQLRRRQMASRLVHKLHSNI